MSLRLFLPIVARRSIHLAALALLLAGLAGPARADIQQSRQRNSPSARVLRNLPANGVDQSVQVSAGGQVEITLQAHGQEGKTIDFLPRDNPTHGHLVDLHLLSRNSASVTYVQDPGDNAQSDQFSYSVQAQGSVVSASATVSIQIVPLPPHLVATPAELDFGAVNVGENSRAQVTIENIGGSPATGQLMPPSPWMVDGSPEYKLGKGEKQTFQLVFNPNAGRVFEDEIVLGNKADQRAHLFGTGIGAIVPLIAQPEQPTMVIGAKTSGAPAGSGAAGNSGGVGATGTTAGTASASPPNANAAPAPDFAQGAAAGSRPIGATYTVGRDAPILNEAAVNKIEARWHDAHGIKIAWKTPEPAPQSYRVELRYLSIDPDNKRLVIDWRSYAQTEFQPGKPESAAILRGLPAGTRQTIRVVAVDSRGRAAVPSPMIQVDMAPGSDLLRITPLRLLFAALAVCLVLLWRRKREARQLMEEVAESRATVATYS